MKSAPTEPVEAGGNVRLDGLQGGELRLARERELGTGLTPRGSASCWSCISAGGILPADHVLYPFKKSYAGRMDLSLPENQLAIRRAAAQLCAQSAWAVLHELPLPNGRRADLFALRPDGGFVCIEVKSGIRDFMTDLKWPEYLTFCDEFYFAIDSFFPSDLVPHEAGIIVTSDREADIIRAAPIQPLPPARRRALLHRFATVAAARLNALEDPMITSSLRAALRAE